ncbi:trans-AT polyketide synthase/acyltransferase/oxidoreductase domain-containing protein [Agrobacterium vitis]|nr:trans-AT polyketide synthase/acyltransferase/oxidoreductase domain-containing protein [Agrobacterium vitis]MBE1436378.1 trans-AT polyketide synthase/acyltransferase/oxidoreductase domain-containing protein [Agrobacterium vitis]
MLITIFPGQGSQHIGMGKDFFDRYPREVQLADRILGYSVRDLCLNDKEGRLNQTNYTQPLLFFVNALHERETRDRGDPLPSMVAGHSLGEYNALLAAGVFDLETGLRLVAKRGELMSKAEPGSGMAAVIGLDGEAVAAVLAKANLDRLDIANINSPTQVVISGLLADIAAAQPVFEAAGARYVKLNVSAAFHSRYMRPAQEEFSRFLAQFQFSAPRFPVIANVTARPYATGDIAHLLTQQITGSVRWVESVRYLLAQGEVEFQELGPKRVLTDLVKQIRPLGPLPQAPVEVPKAVEIIHVAVPEPIIAPAVEAPALKMAPVVPFPAPRPRPHPVKSHAEQLGSNTFKADHGVRHAYLAGGMHKGISSVALVAALARRGFLASLGTLGLSVAEVEARLIKLRSMLAPQERFSVNIVSSIAQPDHEQPLLALCGTYDVTTVEVSGYIRPTAALVAFRLRGLERREGKITARNRIIAKLSQIEVAEAFLQPAPERLLNELLANGEITAEQAQLARHIPVADDICLAAEGGWYSERGNGWLLFPALRDMRDKVQRAVPYQQTPRIGFSGGIGDPEAAAAAFFMGADFIVTGTINQCTVEAETSDAVKDLLQDCGLQDTVFAPGGDFFEFGAQIQFLRKGILFPARASKLYQLYQTLGSLDELDVKMRRQLEEKYFGKSLEAVWQDVVAHWQKHWPEALDRAAQNPRHKLLLVLRWYFHLAFAAAQAGQADQKVQFAIPCGTAMGTCNHWLKNTALQHWRNRPVADLAQHLLDDTAAILHRRFEAIRLSSS